MYGFAASPMITGDRAASLMKWIFGLLRSAVVWRVTHIFLPTPTLVVLE
jgi:hypothetical protein